MPGLRHLPPAGVLVLLAPLLLVSGCTAGGYSMGGGGYYGGGRYGGGYYGSRPVVDPCGRQRAELTSANNYFARDILTGALIGATGGGVVGSLVSGDLRGALTGAATGGVTGAIAGYWQALQQQNRDQANLDSTFSGDIGRENSWIKRSHQWFDALMACRLDQARMVRADYAAGRIDQATAEARLAAVRRAAADDLALARRIHAHIDQRSAEFVYAADHLSPGTKAAVQGYRTRWYAARINRDVPVLLRPEPGAPEIGRLPSGSVVKAAAGKPGFALVKTKGKIRGFVPRAALVTPRPPPPPPKIPSATPVESLAGSNAARRDAFAQSVAVGDNTVANGFQLSG